MNSAPPEPVRQPWPEPPFAPELLAEFQAGVLPQALSEHIATRLPNDPRGREVLAALESTRTELGRTGLPDDPMPTAVRARLSGLIDGLRTD